MNIKIFALFLLAIIPINSYSEDITNCSNITVKENEFTGEKQSFTPLINQISISKVISKNKKSFYLYLNTIGSTVVVDGKGAHILFDDKTKWYKNVKINVDTHEKGFNYSAFIRLNNEEFQTLKNKKIQKYMLYIFEDTLNDEDAESLRTNAKCLEKI